MARINKKDITPGRDLKVGNEKKKILRLSFVSLVNPGACNHEFKCYKEYLLKIIIELNCYFLSLPCIKWHRTKQSPWIRRSVFVYSFAFPICFVLYCSCADVDWVLIPRRFLSHSLQKEISSISCEVKRLKETVFTRNLVYLDQASNPTW